MAILAIGKRVDGHTVKRSTIPEEVVFERPVGPDNVGTPERKNIS